MSSKEVSVSLNEVSQSMNDEHRIANDEGQLEIRRSLFDIRYSDDRNFALLHLTKKLSFAVTVRQQFFLKLFFFNVC